MRILYIEDDLEYANLIQTFLAGYGLRPELDVARTMNEGVSMVETVMVETVKETERSPYDLILLDLILPDSRNPIETYQTASKAAIDIPIVVMTGMYDESLIKKLIDLGARSYLIKPQTNRALLDRTIEFVIENQRIRQAMTIMQTEQMKGRGRLDELIDSAIAHRKRKAAEKQAQNSETAD